MEELGVLVVLGIAGVLVAWPIWLTRSIFKLRQQLEEKSIIDTSRWQDLTARLFLVEKQLKDAAKPAHPETADLDSVKAAELVETPPSVQPIPPPKPVETPSTAPVPPPPVPVQEEAHRLHEAVRTPAPVAPREDVHVPEPVVSPPMVVRSETPVSLPESARSGLDLEEIFGTNWLNKIGIGILVLGLAFFLAYQLQNLGPAGKVLLGVVLSAGMIGLGVYYEANERYRILARASAAGGWSLLYFLSYAIYHVPAAQVIHSPELDFVIMLAVAGAILWYSLRYRSQATTTLALVLSYLTVGIHHSAVYGLIAVVILAATVVALALRMQWFALEVFGIAATYFSHYLWVQPFVDAMGARPAEFPQFRLSAGLLVLYWLLFRISYVYRQLTDDDEEKLSTVAALLNSFGLLILLRYQSVHPEWTFWALLVFGAVELGFAALAAHRRRVAFIVLATIGSALLVAAFPFRYTGSDLSILWLAAAEAFLLAGVFTTEVVFRRIGLATGALVAAQMVMLTAAPLLDARVSGSEVTPLYTTSLLFAVAALVFYANAHWVSVRWGELFKHEFDRTLIGGMSYVAALLLLFAALFAFPGMWTAVAWGVLALALNIAGNRLDQGALAGQGNAIAVVTIVRLVTLNLYSTEQWHGVSLRLVTGCITAILLYLAAPFATPRSTAQQDAWTWFKAAYTWAASILIAWLVLDEVAWLWVAVVWMAMGLVLLEIGLLLRAGFLRWQAYCALIASFARMFLVNLGASSLPGQLSPRLKTVVPLAAAYFYAEWRLRRNGIGEGESAEKGFSSFFSYLGVATVAALIYCELQHAWIATGWAVLSVTLLSAAFLLRKRGALLQSYLVAGLVALREFTYNFTMTTTAGARFPEGRAFIAGVAIGVLFAGLPLAFAIRQRARRANASPDALDSYPEQVFFFIPFALLTTLIALESTRGQLTLTWGIEGLVVFLFALVVGERSFRLAGLALLLLCVAKIFLLDVWGLDPQSRYITLIVLGAALVFVSFLYTRHKEKFRKYL